MTTKLRKVRENHGMSYTRIYRIWEGMRIRCGPGAPCDERTRYYEAGIRVCPEWQNSFLAFHKWAMENGYTDKLSIDRKDATKGYSPDNCRWATEAEQMANTRKRGGTSSQYKGVTWSKQRGKWMALIHHNKQSIYLGLFTDEKEAAMAYNRKAKELYGDFANLNQV